MIGFQQNKYGAENIGKTVTVPNDCVARLMYYLDCFETVTEFGIPYALRDYSNYRSLDTDDKRNLLQICETLTIRVLQEAKLFIMVAENQLKDTSNEFYKLTKETQTVGLTREIMIAGKRVRAVKIMFFTRQWAERNYLTPMRELENQLTRRVQVVYRRSNNDDCNVM